MRGSGIPTKMFFAAVTLPFLRALTCLALLDQVFTPTAWTFNCHRRMYHYLLDFWPHMSSFVLIIYDATEESDMSYRRRSHGRVEEEKADYCKRSNLEN
jgi:hypothetical protein